MDRRLMSGSISIMVALCVAGCAHREHAETKTAHGTHWSYSGSTGPAYWGSLSPEYSLCSTGRSQSPIDIATATPRDLPNIAFSYQATPLNIISNGHTVQVNCAPGSSIELEGERFELAQFHFHLPSEHTVKGSHADGEMHLVHKSATGRLAVVGVMLREGPANPMFDVITRNIPDEGKTINKPEVMVNVAGLLPADQRTFRYDGSLTTPPGTEGVRWSLMIQPVTLSASQLRAFREHYNGNNRPVQSLNGREILQDSTQ